MSALALVAHEWGAEVGGSDRASSSYVERLEAAGIPVAIGHDAANVPEGAEVIVSSAIAVDNPEVSRARVKKKRAELLAELVELRPSIVVAGAHGKTTTTAMIAFVLDRLGRDPSFLIGGGGPPPRGEGRGGGGGGGRGRGGGGRKGFSAAPPGARGGQGRGDPPPTPR